MKTNPFSPSSLPPSPLCFFLFIFLFFLAVFPLHHLLPLPSLLPSVQQIYIEYILLTETLDCFPNIANYLAGDSVSPQAFLCPVKGQSYRLLLEKTLFLLCFSMEGLAGLRVNRPLQSFLGDKWYKEQRL